jgi:hypothetical protein
MHHTSMYPGLHGATVADNTTTELDALAELGVDGEGGLSSDRVHCFCLADETLVTLVQFDRCGAEAFASFSLLSVLVCLQL